MTLQDRLIDQLLCSDGGSAALAIAAVQALGQLMDELDPLIGAQAVQALYWRSLHLARSPLDRPAPQTLLSRGDLLAPLRHNLMANRPADARRDAQTLLNTLVDLLASLIGQPLTHRLMQAAWGGIPATNAPARETTP